MTTVRTEIMNEREAMRAMSVKENFVTIWVTLALIALVTGVVLWLQRS